MDASHTRNSCCDDCSGRMICHCLQITEEVIISALDTFAIQSVQDLRRFTGAGDGCTACHKRLCQLIERRAVELPVVQASSPSPI